MIKAFAAFEPKGELRPFEYDPGSLKPHEVEIDVQYCGICHSDLSVIDNEWGMTQYPVVPGHEVVGKIAKAEASSISQSAKQSGWAGTPATATNVNPVTRETTTCAPTLKRPSSDITAVLPKRCARLPTV